MSVPSVPIGLVATFNPPAPALSSISSEEVAFVPMAAISEDGTMRVADYRLGSELSNGYTYFQDRDVLVAKITPCYENNKIAQARIDREHGFGSTEFHVLRPDLRSLDARYLLHFLRQDEVRDTGQKRMTGSAGQKRVPKPFLEQLEIPLPPLNEQRRIAEILDQTVEMRRKREEAVRTLSKLRDGIFYSLFGDPAPGQSRWPVRKLADFLSEGLSNGISPSSNGTVDFQVLTLSAVTGRSFDLEAKKFGRFLTEPHARYRLREGDFLICRGNGNRTLVGRGFFTPDTDDSVVFPDTIIAARFKSSCVKPFIEYVWNSQGTRKQLEGAARTTNGTFKVNQSILENIVIIDPPRNLQEKFALISEECQVQERRMADALAKLGMLFASLQHRGFRGEL